MESLWEAIFKAVRITGDGQSVRRWQEHLENLSRRKEKLNALHLKSLHYTNSLGTDLTVELPQDHIWEAGDDCTSAGQPFVANMPTEELFTAPLRTGANGVVVASLPLVHDGNNKMFYFPMFFMLIVTLTSLVFTIKAQVVGIMAGGQGVAWFYIRGIIGVLLVILAIDLVVEGIKALAAQAKQRTAA